MCGIAGFCIHKDDKVNARKLSMALLNQIVSRGEDATGAAWVQSNKTTKKATIAVSKAPVPAYGFEPYMKQMPVTTKRAILHTRWATQGSPENNLNNHPIVSGRVVGVHNGVLTNDNAVFDYFREARKAQVDSEAAFALLNRTVYAPHEVLRSLKGRAALAWLDARDKRDLHLARVDGSPLAIACTHEGSLIFASTLPLLVAACADAKVDLAWVEDIEPMTYLRVRNGEILETVSIGESRKEIA
jgi:glucosamine 6-phosphate synthetase-like amidotransferase/phosphosugar isomerase protein